VGVLSKHTGINAAALCYCPPNLTQPTYEETKLNMLYFVAQMVYYTNTSQPKMSKKKRYFTKT